MAKLFLEQMPVTGKKVLVRVDFNVPLSGDGLVLDTTRIEATLPSLRYLLTQGAAVILMSHLGRPTGFADPEFSLKPIIPFLKRFLDKDVKLTPDCTGPETKQMVADLKPGNLLLLENLRFYRAEEHPEEDPEFASILASYGDFYIDDAFATAHRKHSSTYTITQFFPGKAGAGYLMEKEIKFLGDTFMQPQKPFFAIIGGAKISTKLGVLKSLLDKVDGLLIGGAMAYTFLKAQGKNVGLSLVENDLIGAAKEVIDQCAQKNIQLILPIDVLAAKAIDEDAETRYCLMQEGIPDDFEGVDIGPHTLELFKKTLKTAKTVFWNGPVGVFEMKPFSKGTFGLAKIMASLEATTIAGGGDLVSAINESGYANQFTHISTGGGASLEYIEYHTLPGIQALSDAQP
jgi:phosphoglycerate kinase